MASRDTIISDDFVCNNLDNFNDQQALYAFYINPLGIQADSRFAGGAREKLEKETGKKVVNRTITFLKPRKPIN